MLKKLLIIVVLSCFTATVSFAQQNRAKRESQNDKLITALINAEEVRGIYRDDAMYIFTQAPEIKAIFALGKKAIPLLIDHLDDKRLIDVATFSMGSKGEESFEVTVGAASCDLLSYIIREDAQFFDKSCLKDLTEGADGNSSGCVNKKYAIFPEDFWSGRIEVSKNVWSGKTLIVPKSVRRAKRNWQTAYRKHWIHYEKFEK